MATNNSLNVPLSGVSGSVHFVGATSPTFVTPTLGAATATSLAFSPTTSGIIGTTAADNAAAGKVGEFISSIILNASAVSFTSTVAKDLTSITLSAGDWNVWGNITFTASTLIGFAVWTSTSSASVPDQSLYTDFNGPPTPAILGCVTPFARYNVSGATIVYISGTATSTGTLQARGGIYARRIR